MLTVPRLFLAMSAVSLAAADKPAEDLAAPPVVTAQSWLIADLDSGRELAAHLPDEPRKAASTTKIMCAYVVLELAHKDPGVLNEWVTVSKLASGTDGSTAELKEGEQVRVRDGLFALMLPSGNDMGNAFAEHFHPRLAAPGDETPASAKTEASATRRNFVAEMNRTARRLGMQATTYRIAYGDGGEATDFTTTARDLVTLTLAARQNALFREVVACTEHRAKIRLPGGGEREALWKNTNELLQLANYDGVKTGMTTSAGRCLVATGLHAGHGLIVATLGSTSDEARFADSRNLFRWAWR
jgi:D-alanyl-D-alanine carboxypeptidase (penicillin-binding protein 5/6)